MGCNAGFPLEIEERMKRCCFTGHRPEKLRCTESEVIEQLRTAIASAYKEGFRTFISGMARGVDIWAAQIVLKERIRHPDIQLICALPHPDFEKKWKIVWQKQYADILAEADLVKTICPTFSKSAYQKRNNWMVDNSSLVLAVFNGEPGGTANTISYARKQGVEVVIIGS